jgi:hypothetical protein
MIGRKSVIGIAVLCALAVSAFAASSASAGGRAFTCSTSATLKDYNDAHCVTNIGSGGSRGHVEITTPGQAIEGTNGETESGTSAAAPSKLEGTISGFETAVKCTALTGTGTLTNEATFVKGSGTIHYTGCSVTKPPGIGCKVKESKVNTEELKATTSGLAANKLKFEPAGTKFAVITIEGCETAALNKAFPVTGSLIATTNGATTTTAHAEITTQGTLIFGGQVAGLEGALTIKGAGSNPVTLT